MIELATLIEGETVDRWKEEGKVNIKKSEDYEEYIFSLALSIILIQAV